MSPVSISADGDTLFSLSDGGFHSLAGEYTSNSKSGLELVQVHCDYFPAEVEKNDSGDLLTVKSKKFFRFKKLEKGLLIDDQLFEIDQSERCFISRHFTTCK